MMDPKLVKTYLDCGGTFCPFCESDGIAGKNLEVEDTVATQSMYCMDCEEEWEAVYRLTLSSIHANGMSYDGTATDNERSYGHDRENTGVSVQPAERPTE